MSVRISAPGGDAGSIDGEHRIQVDLFDALCQVMRGPSMAAMRQVLEQAVAYTEAHFMSEQLLMRLCSYPEFDAHVLDHDRMMEVLQDFMRRATDQTIAPQEADRLRDMLMAHIGNRDRAFADYYRSWRESAAGTSNP